MAKSRANGKLVWLSKMVDGLVKDDVKGMNGQLLNSGGLNWQIENSDVIRKCTALSYFSTVMPFMPSAYCTQDSTKFGLSF